MQIRTLSTFILLLLLLISCGGGGGSSTGDEDGNSESPNNEAKGIFIDSPVSGLEYTCASRSGATSDQGEFQCDINSDISFSVGGVLLGTTKFATTLSPVDLVDNGSTRNIAVQNIARFLQMLDYDSDPSNGIEITPEVRNIASGWQQINFSLELDITDYISDAASVDNTPHNLPDGDIASSHLEQSLGLQEDTTLSCSNSYPETPFCDDATFPTCDTTNIPFSSIVSGMKYDEVVDVIGCHGVLTSATTTSSTPIAIYAWGSRTGYDWVITFIERDGAAVVHSATKY
jgi:hypothetical protein